MTLEKQGEMVVQQPQKAYDTAPVANQAEMQCSPLVATTSAAVKSVGDTLSEELAARRIRDQKIRETIDCCLAVSDNDRRRRHRMNR